MPKKLSDEEYYLSLPLKQVGAGTIFLNDQNEILILKPDYRQSWLIPGGSVDQDESPLACAIRETKEEIGLDVSDQRLVCVTHSPGAQLKHDAIRFIFYGGVLTQQQIDSMQLQADEIEAYKFVSVEEAETLLSPSLKRCLTPVLEAIQGNTVAYVESK